MIAAARRAVDGVFRRYGRAAQYRVLAAQGGSLGDPVAVTVVVKRPDEVVAAFSEQIQVESIVLELRAAEVATAKQGDVVVLDGETLTVEPAGPEDPDRPAWTLGCSSAS